MDPPGGGDDKSNKGRSRSGRPHAMMDASGSSVLNRSYSASVATTRTGSSSASASASSSCQQQQQQQQQAGSSSSSKKKKCVAEAVKEHRARFYIVRRCVSLLVCWRDY